MHLFLCKLKTRNNNFHIMFKKYVRHISFWIAAALLIVITGQPELEAWKDLALSSQFIFYFLLGMVAPFYLTDIFIYPLYAKEQNKNRFWFIFLLFLIFYVILVLLFIRTLLLSLYSIPIFSSVKAILQSLYIILINTIVSCSISAFFSISKNEQKMISRLDQLLKEKLHAENLILKSQFDPHFLFNTLNNIYFQVHADNTAAKQSIESLSNIFRYILYDCQQNLVPCQKELEHIERYFFIQKIRFGTEKDIVFKLGSYSHKFIPPLLIIPLIENAFKHAAKSSKGYDYFIHVEINELDEKSLMISINNRCDSLASYSENYPGTGLNNLRKRLYLLYGNYDQLICQKDLKKDIYYAQLTIPYADQNDYNR